MQDLITKFLGNNSLFSNGAVLISFGFLVNYLKNIPNKVIQFIKNYFVLNVVITSDDSSYLWLEYWVSKRVNLNKNKSFHLNTIYSDVPTSDDDDKSKELFLSPGDGEHFFKYHNSSVWLSIARERLQIAGGPSTTLFVKTMRLTMFKGTKEKLYNLVEEARHFYEDRFNDKIKIYTNTEYGDWVIACVRDKRNESSLILHDDIFNSLIKDINTFISKKEWYKSMGIPRRRGYLLYGEPGNGKTSLVFTIASKLGKDVAVLSLAGEKTSDYDLQKALRSTPKNSIVCIEDIDAVFNKRIKKTANPLSFTGLLNALDGISTREERILFMTTNFKQLLDKALIRPGRADWHIYIGNATHEQAYQLYLRFFPNKELLAARFADKYGKETFSMATLQERLLKYRNCPEEAI